MPKKLTDRQIAELYLGLTLHYKECVKEGMNPADIYNALTTGVHHSFLYAGNPLNQLDATEKAKVYNVLNTFFYATPQYRHVPRQYQGRQFFNDGAQPLPPRVIIREYHHHTTYYRHHDDFLFNWLLINQLTASPYSGGGYGGGYIHHHTDSKEALLFLLLLLVAAAIAACAAVALYYMLSSTVNSIERFIFNEGWLQATMTLLNMAVTTTASTLLASAFAYSPIFSLAIAAGVSNPFGWAAFGVVGLGIIGGALGHLVSEQIQNYIIKQSNQDALDPQDPSRFALTDKEALALKHKNIDPIKVKCAIVALRAELGDKPMPALLTRFFAGSGKEQEILSKIRALRNGQLTEVTVGDMRFNCSADALEIRPPEPQMGYPVHRGREVPYADYQYSYPEPLGCTAGMV